MSVRQLIVDHKNKVPKTYKDIDQSKTVHEQPTVPETRGMNDATPGDLCSRIKQHVSNPWQLK